jgi:hypothetical protein
MKQEERKEKRRWSGNLDSIKLVRKAIVNSLRTAIMDEEKKDRSESNTTQIELAEMNGSLEGEGITHDRGLSSVNLRETSSTDERISADSVHEESYMTLSDADSGRDIDDHDLRYRTDERHSTIWR